MRNCEGDLHPLARKGIILFNEGRYFEAHEELEIAWRQETNSLRGVYQGILEAGVTYLHVQRRNLAGAVKVYKRCLRWLQDLPEVCLGIGIGELRRDLEAMMTEAMRLGPDRLDEIDPALFKPIRWEPA